MRVDSLRPKKYALALIILAIHVLFATCPNAFAEEKTSDARLNVLVLCGVNALNSQANKVGSMFDSNHIAQETDVHISQYDSQSNPATVAGINGVLDAAFSNAQTGDMNVLYYMGHGTVSFNGNSFIDKLGNAIQSNIGACDADPSNGINLSDGSKTSFSTYTYFDLSERLLNYNGHFILILDCCGSGGFVTYGFRKSINEAAKSAEKTAKFTVLTSTADNKDALMGLDGKTLAYTDILLSDACGYPSFSNMKADKNADGILTPFELHSYMSSSLLYRTQNIIATKPQIESSNGDAPFYLIKPGTLKLSVSSVETGINDSSLSVNVTVEHSGGSNTGVRWKSSNPDIVGVGTTGTSTTISGKKAGTATITAYLVDGMDYVCRNTQVSCVVTVKPFNIKDAKISLSKSSYTYTGKAIKPAVKVVHKGTTLKKDTDYAVSYSKNKKMGKAAVKITGKGNYTGTVKKTFKIKPVFKISPTSKTVNIRKTKKLTIKATLKTGTKKPKITWKSSNKKVATVSSKGKVSIKKKGKTTISATIKTSVGTFTAKCKLSVVKKYTIPELKKIANKKVRKKYGKKYIASEFTVYSDYLSFLIRYQGGNTANVLVGAGRIRRDTAKVTFQS